MELEWKIIYKVLLIDEQHKLSERVAVYSSRRLCYTKSILYNERASSVFELKLLDKYRVKIFALIICLTFALAALHTGGTMSAADKKSTLE